MNIALILQLIAIAIMIIGVAFGIHNIRLSRLTWRTGIGNRKADNRPVCAGD